MTIFLISTPFDGTGGSKLRLLLLSDQSRDRSGDRAVCAGLQGDWRRLYRQHVAKISAGRVIEFLEGALANFLRRRHLHPYDDRYFFDWDQQFDQGKPATN